MKVDEDVALPDAYARAIDASAEELRLIADSAPVAVWVTGADGRRSFVNRAYAEFMGLSFERALASDWRDRLHPDDAPGVLAETAANEARLKPFRLLARYRRADGAWRWLESISQPRFDAKGRHIGFVGVAHDVTESKETELALRERDAQLTAFIVQSAAGFGQVDLEGRFTLVNDRFCEICGWSREELIGKSVLDITYADDAPKSWKNFERAVSQGTPYTQEKRYIRKDGEIIWAHNSVSVLRQPDGSPFGLLAVTLDMTEAKRAEAHQQLLIDELNHRVKNTLAIVQGIAHQTFKADADPGLARLSFEGRLAALAGAHNLLTNEHWGPVSMCRIIDETVAAHDAGTGRFTVSGPMLMISPKTAISLALAIHELATNAVKHGALSAAEGRVTIDWQVEEQAGGARLALRWAEHGGPPVNNPTSRGFGTRMIERGLASELGGEVRIEFAPTGLVCTVDASLPRLVE